jgi:MOSC domain-containing protein YiiM
MANVVGIYLWPVSKGEPRPVEEARAVSGVGLDGDRKRSEKRQVTVVSAEQWAQATREAGAASPDARWRRANVVVSGLAFSPEMLGKRLRLGALVIEMVGETEPCHRMDDVHPGLRAALVPGMRAGVFGRIEADATLRVGDEVSVE